MSLDFVEDEEGVAETLVLSAGRHPILLHFQNAVGYECTWMNVLVLEKKEYTAFIQLSYLEKEF